MRAFNLLLSELSLIQKVRELRTIPPVPSTVSRTIDRLNAVRNAVADSFYGPSRYSTSYRGKDVFTLEGLRLVLEDTDAV